MAPKFNVDYGLVLNTRYGKGRRRYGEGSRKGDGEGDGVERSDKGNGEGDRGDSPLKRWKQHANGGSQGRIMLMSNICGS